MPRNRKRTVAEMLRDEERYEDALVAIFVSDIREILSKVAARTLATATSELSVETGAIASTAGNQQTLRRLDRIFAETLRTTKNKQGQTYRDIVGRFADGFPRPRVTGGRSLGFGQFEQIISRLNASLKSPNLPNVEFGPKTSAFLRSRRLSVSASMVDEVGVITGRLVRQSITQAGALGLPDLADFLSNVWQRGAVHLESFAVTTISTHARVIDDNAYSFVEEDTGRALLFKYFGPNDKLVSHKLCLGILRGNLKNEPRTKKEINKLNPSDSNLRSIFTAAGGWRCRHSWQVVGFVDEMGERELF